MKDAIREIISNNWRYFKDPITITEIGQQLASASRLTVDLGEVRVVLDQLKSDGIISEVKPGAFVPLCAKTISGGIVMKSLLCAALCFSSLLIATAATVSDVTARQRYPWNGLVDLHFTITGDAGTKYDTSFTAKDMVGNTNIAMRTIRKADGISAAAKEQLLPGSYNWVWDAAVDLPKDFKCDRVTVTGTANEFKPLYMVIDLSGGANASSYPVSYLDAVPSGGWSDTYKTTKMVLRRVSKGTNSAGGSMSKDMWVGVFEVTQKQWMLVVNGYPAIYGYSNYSATKGDTLPIEGVEYYYDQPSPFLSKVKTRSGVNVRLPTVTEWQYACRSGTSTDLNNGTSLTVANANKVAYWGLGVSGATAYHKYGHGMGKPTIVGSYAANKWGLFDMHGNVKEYTSTIHYQVGGSDYDACGGGYDSELSDIKASSVDVSQAVGFRVFAEVQ